MNLALPTPTCDEEGNFLSTQCDKENCWCVDNFGTEIPKTRGKTNATSDCSKLREIKECLDLTCRMGCEYGFILSEETGCPLCQCRDPCYGVDCGVGEQCQLVEVNCKDHYCPPVPACELRKQSMKNLSYSFIIRSIPIVFHLNFLQVCRKSLANVHIWYLLIQCHVILLATPIWHVMVLPNAVLMVVELNA